MHQHKTVPCRRYAKYATIEFYVNGVIQFHNDKGIQS